MSDLYKKKKDVHGRSMDFFAKKKNWDSIIFFDVDCIPLHANALDLLMRGPGMCGLRQNATHFRNSPDYMAPAALFFKREDYERCGKPTFRRDPRRYDAAGLLTIRARTRGIPFRMLDVSDVEAPVWQLEDGTWFGYGTTYEDSFYHSFRIRNSGRSEGLFLDKCKSILKGK